MSFWWSNIEKGFTTGSSELIAKIAKALETDVDELLHIADRVDPEAIEVIQKNPEAVPSFLRSAKDLTPEEWDKMQIYLNQMRGERKPKAKKSGKQ